MKLKRSFYARPCLEVARDLIGKHLIHRRGDRLLGGRIVEVEAYVHEEDQACHARFGPTPRALTLYGEPGHAYVFLIYGMYDCFNVVTEPKGSPAAVLIRALEPQEDVAKLGKTDGPGKLCRTLGISRTHNGLDLTADLIWIESRRDKSPKVVTTPRIGVDYAGRWARKPWRFLDPNSPYVSRRK